MATNGRQKGKRGELEIVHLLKKYGVEARRGQQFKGTEDSPDVIHDMTGLAIEVKFRESFSMTNLYDAVDKAQDDAGAAEDAVVFYRRKTFPWLAVMDGERFVKLLQELYDDTD